MMKRKKKPASAAAARKKRVSKPVRKASLKSRGKGKGRVGRRRPLRRRIASPAVPAPSAAAYNQAYDAGFDEAYNEGFNVGYAEGMEAGHQEAYKGA
ncbi:hypothetical protein [Paenibacillus sp. 1P07SE]|uniref:hypothetical protein n=1 Tax=Paenibacillus sp. 1P07SE TaxID=3132209 RepID=UPI0039A60D0F